MPGDIPDPFDFGFPDDDENSSSDNPANIFGKMFEGMPLFGDMMKMFSHKGPIQWETAQQVASMTATNGEAEPNVDPLVRIDYANLARIAGMQVFLITGLGDISDASAVNPIIMTPGTWAQRTLDDYRPLFTNLATALGNNNAEAQDSDQQEDPFAAMFAGITGMIAPMTMGMTVGSMVGHLAKKSLGQYDLPLPRPVGQEIAIISTNVDTFASQWDLPLEDVRMWTLIRELVIHQLYGLEHIRTAVTDLVQSYIAAFRPDSSAITDKLSTIESSDPSDMMASLQKILGDPELLLGAVRSSEQLNLQPRIDALLGLIIGWSDHMTDAVGSKVLGNPARIAEAARRQRVQSGEETVFVEKLLGLHINRQQVERGKSFVRGVIERVGHDGLQPLYVSAENLPTPAELDAPGLWLARLEISESE